jgi:ribosomal-protein-alanine N-acetyltransferase
MNIPELTSRAGRIRLIPIPKIKPEQIYAVARDKRIYRYMEFFPYPYKLENAKKFIELSKKHHRQGIAAQFGITLAASGKYVGGIDIGPFNSKHKQAEIGYWITPKYWGQGYVSEAVETVLEYGFTKLKLHRIYARILKGNDKSGAVLLRCGMTYEGCLRHNNFIRGRYYDNPIYSILVDEWKARRKLK